MTNKPYILYIDDDQLLAELVSNVFENLGYTIARACNGASGMTAMRQHKPDLVLLDLAMPKISGYDVYRTMKQDDNLADIPVIVITAESEFKFIEFGLLPPNGYLTKPFGIAELTRVVNEVLGIFLDA